MENKDIMIKKLISLTLITLISVQINANTTLDKNTQDIKSWCENLQTTMPDCKDRANVANLILNLFNSLQAILAQTLASINKEQASFESMVNKMKGKSPQLQDATDKIKGLVKSSLDDSKNLLDTPIKTLSDKLGVLLNCYDSIRTTMPAGCPNLPKVSTVLTATK